MSDRERPRNRHPLPRPPVRNRTGERDRRRFQNRLQRLAHRFEWELKGIKNITAREVSSNLQKRDHIDSTREDSPLRKANDAIEIDNSDMTPEEQLAFSLDIVENVLRKTKINS